MRAVFFLVLDCIIAFLSIIYTIAECITDIAIFISTVIVILIATIVSIFKITLEWIGELL